MIYIKYSTKIVLVICTSLLLASMPAYAGDMDKREGKKSKGSNYQLSQISTPAEIIIDRPPEIYVDTPSEITIDRPSEINVKTPSEIIIDRPSDINVDTPSEITIDRPSEINIQTPPEIIIDRSSYE
jgi:hypothetical protein